LTLSQIKGLAFDGAGSLFGVDLQPTSFLSDIVTIDPATGIITTTGATQTGVISLAFQPAGVPEPGSLTLVGLAVLLGSWRCIGRALHGPTGSPTSSSFAAEPSPAG
jgi:hypothetical protein